MALLGVLHHGLAGAQRGILNNLNRTRQSILENVVRKKLEPISSLYKGSFPEPCFLISTINSFSLSAHDSHLLGLDHF